MGNNEYARRKYILGEDAKRRKKKIRHSRKTRIIILDIWDELLSVRTFVSSSASSFLLFASFFHPLFLFFLTVPPFAYPPFYLIRGFFLRQFSLCRCVYAKRRFRVKQDNAAIVNELCSLVKCHFERNGFNRINFRNTVKRN